MLFTMEDQLTLPPLAKFSDSDFYFHKHIIQELSNQSWCKYCSKYLQTI